MSTGAKIFLSMSVSGGLLILALLPVKRLLKDKISWRWHYYIWLLVLLRLLVPFGPGVSLLGETYRAADRAMTRAEPLPRGGSENVPAEVPEGGFTPSAGNYESPDRTAETLPAVRRGGTLALHPAGLVWLAVALGLLIRKITAYQGFLKAVRAGLTPVSDLETLDRLSLLAEEMGVKGPVELGVNPLVSSPMLIGFLRPCVVLPGGEVSQEAFRCIVLHELTHYRRRDLVYKWLVQVTLCLHWFNPLVYRMSEEIERDCEFSCDEAVLARMGEEGAQDYGRTLLDAMAAAGTRREPLGAVPLSGNKRLLKERLEAIMGFRRKSGAAGVLTALLTLWVVLGASFVGVYSATSTTGRTDWTKVPLSRSEPAAETVSQLERYYEAGSLPLFQIGFSRLGEEEQDTWLERIYEEDQLFFWGAAAELLEEDGDLVRRYAEKTYEDDSVAWFSVLTARMGQGTLEAWLDRALEDGKWAFQSVLFGALDREEEFDKEFDKEQEDWEKEWEAAQAAAYQAVGVTREGKAYYYRGQLVRIFLDIRANRSFYTLDLNPAGTVDVKILRDGENNITGAAYMTEAEVAELLEDRKDPEEDGGFTPVDLETVGAGEAVFLGTYTLSEGDGIYYDISAETGERMRVFFARGEERNPVYWSVDSRRQQGEMLTCAGAFTVGPPAGPGTYRLYLQAPEGALGKVTGGVWIACAEEG